jgi:hypothetical protein
MLETNMHEDGSTLQKLTQQQVSARLAAYNENGEFERDLRDLWDSAGELLEESVRERFGDNAARQIHERCTSPVDEAWVHSVAAFGIQIYTNRSSVPVMIDKHARMVSAICDRLRSDLPTIRKYNASRLRRFIG